MSTQRKITITLTEQQYRTLGGAVESAVSEWSEFASDADEGPGGYFTRSANHVEAAWSKINRAWHAKERRS